MVQEFSLIQTSQLEWGSAQAGWLCLHRDPEGSGTSVGIPSLSQLIRAHGVRILIGANDLSLLHRKDVNENRLSKSLLIGTEELEDEVASGQGNEAKISWMNELIQSRIT
uniref:Uncharacterized protein n=1 Tax=Sphaerodactylus townsendi TaxID=933632 RepID=A0ACB8FCY3_9SAUR